MTVLNVNGVAQFAPLLSELNLLQSSCSNFSVHLFILWKETSEIWQQS